MTTDAPLFRGRAGPAALIAIGLLVIVGLISSTGQQEPQSGPSGSTYATHASGTAALATLLERNGYNVSQVRTPLAELPPSPDDVLVIIGGPRLDFADTDAAKGYVAAGGRLVSIEADLTGIVASPPGRLTRTQVPASALLTAGPFGSVTSTTPGFVWSDAGSLLPLVGNDDGALLGITHVGEGTVVAIADSAVVENAEIDQGDNALLALQAVGDTAGTVRFVEYIHGFTRPTGLSALPTRWKEALVVLAAAGILWLIAKGKRFEPVEESDRSLAPPRAAYVDAVAQTLSAGKDPEAAELLDHRIERELTRRGVTARSGAAIEAALQSGADQEICTLALSSATDWKAIRAKSILLSHLVNKEQL